MTNWKIFKTVDGATWRSTTGGEEGFLLYLDGYVEYSDGYEKYINLFYWSKVTPCGVTKLYIEIDMDKTKCRSSEHVFLSDVWRIVPNEVVAERNRNAMINASQADPTTLAITREGMDRNEQREFEYKIEDRSGKTHTWIYRNNRY